MTFIMKNPRFQLQLLLGLLLVLGTVPGRSEGKKLKCFSCEDCDKGKGDHYKAEICESEGDHCLKVFQKQGDETSTSKGCEKADILKCFRTKYNDACVTAKEPNDIYELQEHVKACQQSYFNKGRQLGGPGDLTGVSVTVCTCDDHLCNAAGYPTSNNMLTFAIIISLPMMTAAISGGASGSL